MKISLKDVMLTVIFILVLLAIKDSKADMLEEYNNEFVTYIVIDNKVLPEHTKFVCENKVLYKNKQVVRMYTGKAKTCKKLYIRRVNHAKDYDTTNLF